jgi:hypothetical protein
MWTLWPNLTSFSFIELAPRSGPDRGFVLRNTATVFARDRDNDIYPNRLSSATIDRTERCNLAKPHTY